MSGIRESSNTVPTVTVNCLRHARHFSRPLRPGRALSAFGVSRRDQLRRNAGTRDPRSPSVRYSMYSRALSSSLKCSPSSDHESGVFSMNKL